MKKPRTVPRRKLILFLLVGTIAPWVAGPLYASRPIRVSDDFESGSLGVWRVEGNTRLVFVPRLEHDQDGINTALTWFYGRLENTAHREVTLVATGLDYTVYKGRRGTILPYERNTVPVFSYDREHWQRFTDCSFDEEAREFRMRQVFSRDPVWVAYTIPYTLSRLEGLLAEVGSHPEVSVEILGRSVEGRPLYLVTVAGPTPPESERPVVWIATRQHSFESGGSWSVEGLLRWLTSDDPEAARLRRRVVFRVCPMLNPDGVVRGGTRFNARGVDLNRHWHESDPLSNDPAAAPEIGLVKRALESWTKSNRLDLWINIHNNDMVWNEDGDYIRFAPAAREGEARRLEEILREETVYTGPFLPTLSDGSTEAVVSEITGAIGLLMEMKTGYLDVLDRFTGEDVWLDHGRGLALAASRFLTEDR
jgi:hypothetical protein